VHRRRHRSREQDCFRQPSHRGFPAAASTAPDPPLQRSASSIPPQNHQENLSSARVFTHPGSEARMRSARSACLFFHLKLPKMLRCQRSPPQTFQEAAAAFRTAQSSNAVNWGWALAGCSLSRSGFCRVQAAKHSGPADSARAASTNLQVLMMRASGVRHAWEAPFGGSSPARPLIPPKSGRCASRRFAWQLRARDRCRL
jgi:hypothetical protein